mmetsp:Transcript_17460/g.37731  ORF Transcript_17460/g.37731 Transcript_17460/m.37731 type:complete len:221 (-) Transcript_17460:1082-1744(-)
MASVGVITTVVTYEMPTQKHDSPLQGVSFTCLHMLSQVPAYVIYSSIMTQYTTVLCCATSHMPRPYSELILLSTCSASTCNLSQDLPFQLFQLLQVGLDLCMLLLCTCQGSGQVGIVDAGVGLRSIIQPLLRPAHQANAQLAWLVDRAAEVAVVKDGKGVAICEPTPVAQADQVCLVVALTLSGSLKEASLIGPAGAHILEAPAGKGKEHVVGPKVKGRV